MKYMKVYRSYKVKLYPNKAQEQELLKILGGCRFVWNHFLALSRDYYLEHKKTLKYFEMSRQLTQLRKTAPELSGLQLSALSQSLRRLHVAYNRFLRRKSNFPRFKSYFDSKQSFQKPKDWKIVNGKISVQGGLVLKCRGNLPKEGRTLIISYQAGKWFASILTEEEIKVPKKHSKPIGIDVGLSSLAIVSNGDKYNVPSGFLEKQLALLQRKLARQEIRSKRRAETRNKIARLYQRIANKRLDTIHKTTDTILAKNPSLVATETLHVKGMMRNHKLARSIGNASWGEFFRQIDYKTKWRGGEVVKVDRFFPSSKTCHKCFFVADKLPLEIREWDCPQCGTHHDRDVNAAKVILLQGQGMPRAESVIG